MAGDAAIHLGIDDEPSWDCQTSRHANDQFDPRTTELSRDDTTSHSTSVVDKRPSYSAVKTSTKCCPTRKRPRISPTAIGTRLPKRRVRVKPDRNGDTTDERLHCCERRRWKRGREERGAQQEETTTRIDDRPHSGHRHCTAS